MKTTRKSLALVLCMCMVLSCVPAMQAAAAEAVSNEPFEIYNENAEPRGWSITSLSDSGLDEAGADWAGSYTFGIVKEDDGNTAIAINKNSIGYGALTTPSFAVQAGNNYRLSFAYRNNYVGVKDEAQTDLTFWGMRITVHFYDADGTELTTAYKTVNSDVVGGTVSEDWTQVTYDFEAVAGAASTKVFFGLGGQKNAVAQMLIDDYSISAYAADELPNGDFNGIVHEKDGARDAGVDGPATWDVISANINGNTFNTSGYENKYVISTVEENGDKVLELKPLNLVQGYAVAHSAYVKAEENATYVLKYDQKTTGYDVNNGAAYRGARVFLYFYDSNKAMLGYQEQAVKEVQDWTTKTLTATTPEGTAYLAIGLYIGGVWNSAGDFAYYYDDISLTKIDFNGDFEFVNASGVPYSWTKTSMTAGSAIETKNNWAANYTLAAAVGQGVNGSNAASLTKNSTGYAALTSAPVAAKAGSAYRVTYTYKTTSIAEAVEDADFYGIHAVAEFIGADGNTVADGWIVLNNTSAGKGQTVSSDWETVTHDVIAPAGAVSVRVYLAIGGKYYVKATVLFDNVTVTEYAADAVVNADFNGTVNQALGGRNGATEGPSGWNAMTTNSGGNWDSAGTNNFINNYTITTVTEADGNKVMKIAPCTTSTGTRGYVVAYSQPMAVEEATTYTLTYDQKIDVGESSYNGAKIMFYYFDENMEYIAGDWKGSSTEAHDWQAMSNTVTTRANTAYMIVGFFMGGAWDKNPGIAYYYDNIVVKTPSYQVTYVADGVTIAQYTVKHGEDVPAIVKVPEKDGNIGAWDHNGLNITADMVITANYTDLTTSPLWLESVLFSGDSICSASDKVGWAGRIGEKYSMNYVNAGVSGASVSTVRTGRMIDQIKKYKANAYDFVILHGGTNDAWSEAPIGEMTDSYALSQFDPDTFAGALEELFYYAKLYYTDAKFGYIINFRFASDNEYGYLADMTEYVEMTKSICDKWDIPYLDLYNNEELNEALNVGVLDNFVDSVHPNAAGYDIITPYIENWMIEVVANHEAKAIPAENAVELWNIKLGDDIGANFYVTVSDSAQATVTIKVADDVKTTQISTMNKNENGYYVFSTNVAAAQMTDNIGVKITCGDVVIEKNYTVLDYAMTILNGEYDDVTKALVAEMLNYGAAAQTYFGYNTENTIDSALIAGTGSQEIDPAAATDMVIEGRAAGISLYGATLLFKSKTAVRFYFSVSGDISGYTFTAGEKTLTPVEKDGMYYVEIGNINPQDLANQVTVTVTAGEQALSVSYGPMNYVVRMNETGSDSLKALLKAMYNYHLAAVAYVNAEA